MVVTGIIKPPPDIRAVVNRTALFVSKNGRAFETKILAREEGKSKKFDFLHSTSPFHAYYEDRVTFYQNGGTDDSEKKEKQKQKEEEEKKAAEKKHAEQQKKSVLASHQKASVVDVVAKAMLTQRQKIMNLHAAAKDNNDNDNEHKHKNKTNEENKTNENTLFIKKPRDMIFVNITAPARLTSMQIDTIKIMAQFTALASTVRAIGGGFLDSVTRKECWQNNTTNPVFDFLKPRHPHFAYFSALVDCYKKIAARNDVEHLEHLKRCAGVDVDVDVGIDIGAAGKDGSAPPSSASSTSKSGVYHCLEDAAYRCEYYRYHEEEKRRREEAADSSSGEVLGGSAYVDWHDFVVVETIAFPYDEVVVEQRPAVLDDATANASANGPAQTQTAHAIALNAAAALKEDDMDMDMDMDSDDDDDGEEKEQIRVVPDYTYTPKVVDAASTMTDATRTHMIDPITGRAVALADMSEHMRIQLLDPKWAAEKRRFLEKQKDSNFVAGDQIASNINRFAQQRSDIFGGAAGEEAAADSKRRLEEANRIMREQAARPQPALPLSLPLLPGPMNGNGIVNLPVPHHHQLPPPSMMMPPLPQQSVPSFAPPPSFPPPPPPPAAAAAAPPPLASSILPPVTTATVDATNHHPKPDAEEAPEAKKPRLLDLPLPVGSFAVPPSFPPPPASAAPSEAPSASAPALALEPTPTPTETSEVEQQEQTIASSEESNKLLSEDDFVASLPDSNVQLSIVVPNDENVQHWMFNGQTLAMSVDARHKVKMVKEELKLLLGGMPVNKMQLRYDGTFLKDSLSLGVLNIGPLATLHLVPKTRGGRK